MLLHGVGNQVSLALAHVPSAVPGISKANLAGLALSLLVAEEGSIIALKTLISLNKASRPCFLGDTSICSFPSVASLSDYSIWRS